MSSAAEPQNDRELLLDLNQQVKRLSRAIEDFSDKLTIFEEKKIADMEKRVKELEKWQNEWGGVYKCVLSALSIGTIYSIIIRYA